MRSQCPPGRFMKSTSGLLLESTRARPVEVRDDRECLGQEAPVVKHVRQKERLGQGDCKRQEHLKLGPFGAAGAKRLRLLKRGQSHQAAGAGAERATS